MEPGDWLAVARMGGLYDHHGVYVGHGRVVHFTGEPGRTEKHSARIAESPLEDFACGGTVRVVRRRGRDGARWVARARAALGASGYHLLFRNCENFADWATGGDGESVQVEAPLRRALTRALRAARRSSQPYGLVREVLLGLAEGFVTSRQEAMR